MFELTLPVYLLLWKESSDTSNERLAVEKPHTPAIRPQRRDRLRYLSTGGPGASKFLRTRFRHFTDRPLIWTFKKTRYVCSPFVPIQIDGASVSRRLYRIGSVAALTGIAVERLRAWERRHDFSPATSMVEPAFTAEIS